MKNVIILLSVIFVIFSSNLEAQIEFGTIGSFWNYGHEPHDGNGSGWDKIVVIGDTIIDGVENKILSRTFYRNQTYPPFAESSGEVFFGHMKMRNDSVFINDKLIIDFGMEAGDTLNVFGGYDLDVEIALSVDSVTIINLNGFDYKKYHGNKLCPTLNPPEFYQEFEAIESIGPVGFDFFAWNIDGCILGGGSAILGCYKNEEFTYPESVDCMELILVSANEFESGIGIECYPNPAQEKLTLRRFSSKKAEVEIINLKGEVVQYRTIQNVSEELDIDNLPSSIYFIKVTSGKETAVLKFIKE